MGGELAWAMLSGLCTGFLFAIYTVLLNYCVCVCVWTVTVDRYKRGFSTQKSIDHSWNSAGFFFFLKCLISCHYCFSRLKSINEIEPLIGWGEGELGKDHPCFQWQESKKISLGNSYKIGLPSTSTKDPHTWATRWVQCKLTQLVKPGALSSFSKDSNP